MGDHVRMYTQRTVQSKLRNEPYEIPVFSYPETPGVTVSSRWSPEHNLIITSIEVSCAINTEAIGGTPSYFTILKGMNNKEIDFGNPFDILLLGGQELDKVQLVGGRTQQTFQVMHSLSTSEWIAVAHYQESCSAQSPSIRFYSEIQKS